jgi:hypothetical protein
MGPLVIDWLCCVANALGGSDELSRHPGVYEASSSDPLRLPPEMVGSFRTVRVVGIGEGTHGTREFKVLRDELTRLLVENYGFTVVMPEMMLGASGPLRDLGGEADFDAYGHLLDRVGGWIWNDAQAVRSFQWLQAPERRLSGTIVLPMDVQDPQGDLERFASILTRQGLLESEVGDAFEAVEESAPVRSRELWFTRVAVAPDENAHFEVSIQAGDGEGRVISICESDVGVRYGAHRLRPSAIVATSIRVPQGNVACRLISLAAAVR